MPNRITRGAIWFALVYGLLTACAPSAPHDVSTLPIDKLAEIKARNTLVSATDPAYPPQSELVPGAPRADNTRCTPIQYTANQLTGFDVDTAVEIAQRLGVEACFVAPQWSQLIAGNWGDRWDISVGSMAITPERLKVLYFAQPYYATPAIFYVYRENTTYSNPAGLSGKRIGVCAGCTFESYLNGTLDLPGPKIEFLVKNPQIIAYDTEEPALRDLALGDGVKLDAVLTQLPTGQGAIRNGLPIRPLDHPAFFAYAAPAIDRKSGRDPVAFVREINRIVQDMHRDGTLQRLSEHYHGLDLATVASQFDIAALGQLP